MGCVHPHLCLGPSPLLSTSAMRPFFVGIRLPVGKSTGQLKQVYPLRDSIPGPACGRLHGWLVKISQRAVSREIEITPQTRWINVESGETVRLVDVAEPELYKSDI